MFAQCIAEVDVYRNRRQIQKRKILDDRPDKCRAPVYAAGRLACAGFTVNDQNPVGGTTFVARNKDRADNEQEDYQEDNQHKNW